VGNATAAPGTGRTTVERCIRLIGLDNYEVRVHSSTERHGPRPPRIALVCVIGQLFLSRLPGSSGHGCYLLRLEKQHHRRHCLA